MLPKINRIRSCISKGPHRVSTEASQKPARLSFPFPASPLPRRRPRHPRPRACPQPSPSLPSGVSASVSRLGPACLSMAVGGRQAQMGVQPREYGRVVILAHPCACPSHHGGPRRLLSGPLPVAGPVRSRPISTGPARAHGISPGISRVTRPHGSVGLRGGSTWARGERVPCQSSSPLSVVPCHDTVDSDVTGKPLVARRSPAP